MIILKFKSGTRKDTSEVRDLIHKYLVGEKIYIESDVAISDTKDGFLVLIGGTINHKELRLVIDTDDIRIQTSIQ